MAASKNVKVSAKAPIVFGNVAEIYNFHFETLIPQLENCNNRSSISMVRTFLLCVLNVRDETEF